MREIATRIAVIPLFHPLLDRSRCNSEKFLDHSKWDGLCISKNSTSMRILVQGCAANAEIRILEQRARQSLKDWSSQSRDSAAMRHFLNRPAVCSVVTVEARVAR
jgi:hypothetical protein